jgi:hypothetical protein
MNPGGSGHEDAGQPAEGAEIELLIDNEYEDTEPAYDGPTDGTPDDGTDADADAGSDGEDAAEGGGGSEGEDGESAALKYDPDENLDRKFVIKHNGELIETDLKELKMLAQKGLDFTRKTMELARYRDIVTELKAMGIESPDDLRSVLAGGSEAPTGNESERAPGVPEVERVAEAILAQPDGEEFGGFVRKLPEQAREALAKNPGALSGLYTDYRNGIAPKLYGEVVKIMAMRPDLDFFQAYAMAGKKMNGGGSRKSGTKAPQEPRGGGARTVMDEVLTDEEYLRITQRLTSVE